MLAITRPNHNESPLAGEARVAISTPASPSHYEKLLIRFVERLLEVIPTSRPSTGFAGTLRRRYGIGTGAPGTVHFAVSDISQLQMVLNALRQGDRAALQAMVVLEEDASARVVNGYDGLARKGTQRFSVCPSTENVAILPLNLETPVFAEVSYLTARPEAVARYQPEVLVFCDSMMSLRNLRAMPWVMAELSGRRAVAVFQGDSGPGYTRPAAAAVLRANPVPVLAAVAYSPRGLLAAQGVPRLESICTPRLDWLQQFTSSVTSQRFTKQLVVAGPMLDAIEAGPLRTQWQSMKKFGHAFVLGDLVI